MTDYDTPNRATLNQVWDGIHQEKPFSPIPDNGLVRFTEHVQQQVHRNAPVLDLGCGRGRNSHFLSQIGFQVYGCDWSLLALKTANSHAPPENSISFLAADLTQLPYPDDFFTVIVCVHVLPYLVTSDIKLGIREIRRVLRPEGWAYVDLLDRDDAEYGIGTKLEENTFIDEDGIPLHFCSKDEVNILFHDFQIHQQYRVELGRRTFWELWATK